MLLILLVVILFLVLGGGVYTRGYGRGIVGYSPVLLIVILIIVLSLDGRF